MTCRYSTCHILSSVKSLGRPGGAYIDRSPGFSPPLSGAAASETGPPRATSSPCEIDRTMPAHTARSAPGPRSRASAPSTDRQGFRV